MPQEGTKHMRLDLFEPEGIESFDLAGTSSVQYTESSTCQIKKSIFRIFSLRSL